MALFPVHARGGCIHSDETDLFSGDPLGGFESEGGKGGEKFGGAKFLIPTGAVDDLGSGGELGGMGLKHLDSEGRARRECATGREINEVGGAVELVE